MARSAPIVLLDGPTTFVDIAHRTGALGLRVVLREQQGRTVVAALRLDQAARYATHLIAMRGGAVVTEGTLGEVITAGRVEKVFGLRRRVIGDPGTGTSLAIPRHM